MQAQIITPNVENSTPLSALQEFITTEARLLDDRRFDEWLALFEDDAKYWIPIAWGQADPINHVSLVYESKELLQMRISRLTHRGTTSQFPPSRTCHLIANTQIIDESNVDGLICLRSSFMMTEYRRSEQRLFSGFVNHQLRPSGASYRIHAKRIDLLNCDSEHGLLRFGMPL